MPVTFFAHQLPVLPMARRWPGRLDGVALVVGSMAPDMAYLLNGSRWSVWAHDVPGALAFGIPVTVAVSWIVVRVIAPVVPDHLPDLAPWHLRDYRGLAIHDFRWVATPLSALVGIATHIVLDHFTHDWGWFAQNVSWFGDVFFEGPFGRDWTAYRMAQYIGHVVGTGLCLVFLAWLGRQRWMADRAAMVPETPRTALSTLILAGSTLTGCIAGLLWIVTDPMGSATDLIRLTATTFIAVAIGSLVVSRSPQRVANTPALRGPRPDDGR